jgi:hypothetical protein
MCGRHKHRDPFHNTLWTLLKRFHRAGDVKNSARQGIAGN